MRALEPSNASTAPHAAASNAEAPAHSGALMRRLAAAPPADSYDVHRHAHALPPMAALTSTPEATSHAVGAAEHTSPLRAAMVQGLAALITLGFGYLLKLSYSRAAADELAWVLTPSAFIAQLAGVELVPEPGAGFISRSAHMVVGPSCAGVNFMLACWLALYLSVQADLRRARLHQLLSASALCFAAAYLVTISVNGLRIALAAQLFSLDLGGLLTKTRVHRLLGVTLYSAALLGTCLAAQRLQSRTAQQLGAAGRLGVALSVYLAISLGIPVLNRAFVRHAHFTEHALLTLGGALAVLLLFLLAHRLCSRTPTGAA